MNWHVLIHKAPPEKRRFFYGFSSLFGKAPVCGTGEQGSIPEDTQNENLIAQMVRKFKSFWDYKDFVAQLDRALVF